MGRRAQRTPTRTASPRRGAIRRAVRTALSKLSGRRQLSAGHQPRQLTASVRPGSSTATGTQKSSGPRRAKKGAPPKGGKNVSKRQQRWAFANHMPWAHRTARKGAAFKRLPERKHK